MTFKKVDSVAGHVPYVEVHQRFLENGEDKGLAELHGNLVKSCSGDFVFRDSCRDLYSGLNRGVDNSPLTTLDAAILINNLQQMIQTQVNRSMMLASDAVSLKKQNDQLRNDHEIITCALYRLLKNVGGSFSYVVGDIKNDNVEEYGLKVDFKQGAEEDKSDSVVTMSLVKADKPNHGESSSENSASEDVVVLE